MSEKPDTFLSPNQPELSARMATRHGPMKMNWWYMAIIEWMIDNPDGNLGDCARELNVTQAWLSCIIHSDAFIARRAECEKEHFLGVSHSVIEKMEGVVTLASDAIMERIEHRADEMSTRDLRETADMALKALGFSSNHLNANGAPVQVNVGVGIGVGQDQLATAREKLRLVNSTPSVESAAPPSDPDTAASDKQEEPVADALLPAAT